MDDFGKGLLITLGLLTLIVIAVIYFIAWAALKALRIIRCGEAESPRNIKLARIVLTLIIFAFSILLYLFSLRGESSSYYSSNESLLALSLLASGLIIVGVVAAFLIKPSRAYNYDIFRSIKRYSALRWIITRKYILIPLLIIIPVAAVGAYLKIDLELNKRAFQHAGVAMVEIFNSVVEEVGQPDDNNGSRSCGGFLGVYGEGPISCYLNTKFIYPVKDKRQADQLRERIQALVKMGNLFRPQPPFGDFANITRAESASASVTDYFKTKENIMCTVNYVYDPTFDSRLKLKDPINYKQLYTSFSCSGPARAKYF